MDVRNIISGTFEVAMRGIFGLVLSLPFILSACSSVSSHDAARITCTWGDHSFDSRSESLSMRIEKDSSMTVWLRLTHEDSRKIIDAAKEIHFFSLSHDAPFAELQAETGSIRGASHSVGGCPEYFIRIETEGNTNWVKWDTCYNNHRVDRKKSVWHLHDVIVGIIEQKPEYRKLPSRWRI